MITAVKASSPKKKLSSFSGKTLQTKRNPPSPAERHRNVRSHDIVASSVTRTRLTSDSIEEVNQHSTHLFGWKRCLDLFCIVLSLPVVLPMMAAIILWIRLVSRGPALFRQERVGQNGERFTLYKFRSMKMNSGTSRHETYLRHLVKSDSPMIKLDLLCDSRLIPGGCFLRAAGLDELPQLLNVIRGQMSLVGPRPCLPQEYIYFSSQQRERFSVLPGLTGSWQVSGKNRCTFSEMNVMDIHYANNATLWMDLGIMLKTPSALAHQLFLAAQQKFAARQLASDSSHETSKCDTQRIG